MQIFVMKNNERSGPFTLAQLKALYAEGAISMSDLVWMAGFAEWKEIKMVPEFVDAIVPPINTDIGCDGISQLKNITFVETTWGGIIYGLLGWGMIISGVAWFWFSNQHGPLMEKKSANWFFTLSFCCSARFLLQRGHILVNKEERQKHPLWFIFLSVILASDVFFIIYVVSKLF